MALTTYSYVAGTSAKALTDAVFAAGVSPVGLPIQRGTVLIQFTGEGVQDVGTVSDYKVISGTTPDELVTNVKAVLSSTVQPVGEPVTRGSALFQVMGNITAESGSGSSYTLPAATVDTIGGVKQLANVPALASDADAAAIVTALNAFLSDAKAKGNMAADS